jgi:hypothetical protein
MNPKLVVTCALLSAAIAAAISFAFAVVSAPDPRSRASETGANAGSSSDLRARLDAVNEQLDRLQGRIDVLSSPLATPTSPRTELEPAPTSEVSPCDAHCVALRQQLDAISHRLEALENHIRFGAGLPEAKAAVPDGKRSWGPEQATGSPDSQNGSDQSSAWASLTEDDQDEWLVLSYEREVSATGIKVYENYKPGALSRVTIFTADGSEVEVWRGQDPTSADQQSGVSSIDFSGRYWTDRVKIYLDSRRVKGWNEIDAVALIDDSGRTLWATGAEASSTYASHSQTAKVTWRSSTNVDMMQKSGVLELFKSTPVKKPTSDGSQR